MTPHPLRVGITGIAGRMGRRLAQSSVESGFVVVAGTSRQIDDEALASDPLPDGFRLVNDISELVGDVDVVIDFTHASTVIPHAAVLADAGVPWVLGTTGLTASDQRAVDAAAMRIPVVQAANFSTGVTLVMRIAREMGAVLSAEQYDAEIVEMHHRQKVDAPSGTALAIGEAVAEGRQTTLAAVREPAREGQCGPRKTGAIGFAALRGGQIVGEHTLLFTSATEQIELGHRAFDRRVFADGAVRAAGWVSGQHPGHYSMDDVLGLE
ncbi:4-hydroxy-tetrahydrodipicolinate reductase [Acetobacter fallax]|uniref:4-hydroxy-tetrahydrodipicolinate reductase n=1 Tax=Acetobacter fallax TaxID=1737473 RepID=A0ABX0K7C9_9PROT|nr:4-hydroxy-tetrahydrodipicolinate reductase [Acetobacter fallax]NHO32302.1 4-hydroxy-tetrahydrodipicolinate reductase [Acetobacter fallax]NHO35862.1 4-hydroxy-tetrahydrodipicolinate reductase [Acetobacter fallax]